MPPSSSELLCALLLMINVEEKKKVFQNCKCTCKGMTIMKIFLSLSERMCLTKAQPVPIKAIVINSSAPFSLQRKQSEIKIGSMIKQTVTFKHGGGSPHMVSSLDLHHSQVCNVVDHGPAFNRKALVGDVIVINLKSRVRSINNSKTDL